MGRFGILESQMESGRSLEFGNRADAGILASVRFRLFPSDSVAFRVNICAEISRPTVGYPIYRILLPLGIIPFEVGIPPVA